MLGISKKVERVRAALHKAFLDHALYLAREGHELRANVMVDIATVLGNVKIDEKEIE